MLRLFVLLLVLLNAVYFAWSQGMLRAYGYAPAEQREPQRMQQQIRPEAVRIVTAEEARRIEQAAQLPPKPPECLLSGLLDDAQAEAVRKTAETRLPAGSWSMEAVVEPARWIVYLGKYSSTAARDRRKTALEKMKIKVQPLENPDLQPGLSLAAFETQAQAQKELESLLRRGVPRSARVLQERVETRHAQLRVPAADETLKIRLEELKGILGDKPLRACGK